MALAGAACALLLAVVAGVCSMSARAFEHADAPRRESSLSAQLPGRKQKLLGIHVSPAQGMLELPRPTSKPLPLHPRFDTRFSPAPRPESLLAERTRRQLSCVLPTSHGRVADRPVVANCPAQGPPWTA
jgi:hypothetical protein